MRNLESYSQERKKLIQLGAMAAGLAHELNNPATAARCAAAHLRQSVEKVQDYACELNESLSAEQWRELVATEREAVRCTASQPKLESPRTKRTRRSARKLARCAEYRGLLGSSRPPWSMPASIRKNWKPCSGPCRRKILKMPSSGSLRA